MTRITDRKLTIGAWLWVASLQYYVVQLIVAAAWSNTAGYSWAHNTISDLANTQCGLYGDRLVCSPSHNLMNLSFVILGITMLVGTLLLNARLSSNLQQVIGFWCLAAAGIGTIIVGLFPENSISTSHIFGAGLAFVLGNLGMIILGVWLKSLAMALRYFSVALGLIGLVALGLFMTHNYLGLGIGGMERFVSYPQSIWMIVIGIYLLLSRRAAMKHASD